MTDAPKAFWPHDHRSCANGVLARAVALAEARGLRLTPVRRRALEILLESHRALGAYEVLERLAEAGFGNQPPVAYRALDFLVEHGLVHRVRRLNAFAACMHPGQAHAPALFICRECAMVAEQAVDGAQAALAVAARELGFRIDRVNLEAIGLCPACGGCECS